MSPRNAGIKGARVSDIIPRGKLQFSTLQWEGKQESVHISIIFSEAETYPCGKGFHNVFAPLKDLKGGLQWDPNSSLHYAAAYITNHSCSAGEEPEAPSLPLICPFAMVLNDKQGQEHLR